MEAFMFLVLLFACFIFIRELVKASSHRKAQAQRRRYFSNSSDGGSYNFTNYDAGSYDAGGNGNGGCGGYDSGGSCDAGAGGGDCGGSGGD